MSGWRDGRDWTRGGRFERVFEARARGGRARRRGLRRRGDGAIQGEVVVEEDGGGTGRGGGDDSEGEEDENGERAVEVTCAFDGVDVESVVRHDALNVGAFVVTLKTASGEETARAALLTRVEQDDEGTLRRLVLPFEARFDETEREATPN